MIQTKTDTYNYKTNTLSQKDLSNARLIVKRAGKKWYQQYSSESNNKDHYSIKNQVRYITSGDQTNSPLQKDLSNARLIAKRAAERWNHQ